MVDFLNTSLSGLLAYQRALATTSNNVANAGTPGFSRQEATFSSRAPQLLGGGFVGTGVSVSDVRRIFDGFLAGEVRTATAGEGRLSTLAELSGRVGDLIGSRSGGLSGGLQSFFDSLQALSNDPSSTPVRQTLLGEGRALEGRLGQLSAQLDQIDLETSRRIEQSVDSINGLAQGIADLNQRIVSSPGAADGRFPNELLDQRERLLNELAGEISVSTSAADNGALNVFIGNGQTLVLGSQATSLRAGTGDFGLVDPVIRFGNTDLTRQLSGGNLGGLLDFRREVLDPVRNDLGRSVLALTENFNRIHRQGLDLNGQLGGDFFAVGAPLSLAAGNNSGGAALDVQIADASALTASDYELQFDGTGFELRNLSDGGAVPLSGTGSVADPLQAEGLSIVVNGVPDAGDRFRILPQRDAVRGFQTLIDDPAGIAAAFPVRASSELSNSGDAAISSEEILDASDPNLLTTSTITFIDPNTYQVNGAGSFAFVSGDDIDLNGVRLQITGSPAAGDEFLIQANQGGAGDNRNALELLELREAGVVESGSRSLLEQADTLLARIGGVTAGAQTGLEAQSALLQDSQMALQSVSGVNLEEEAANLIRFQQAFEANARVIQAANTTFQSLLAAVR